MRRYTPRRSGTVIFRRYIRRGNRVLDARDYGLKAWPIHIR